MPPQKDFETLRNAVSFFFFFLNEFAVFLRRSSLVRSSVEEDRLPNLKGDLFSGVIRFSKERHSPSSGRLSAHLFFTPRGISDALANFWQESDFLP